MKNAGLESLKIATPPATLREMALERLRDAIIAGLFEPGQRLVERTLCDQLGVSRSVIREVIRHLDAEGLVEMLPKQGPIVARLDWDHARQIYDIRAALESAAVADCARSVDAATKTRLRNVLNDLDRTSRKNDPTTILDVTTEFYEIIFKTGGHDIAWEIVRRLNSRISRLRVMTLSTGDRIVAGPARIREIFAAIERNDPEAAAKACRDHIAEARNIAESILKKVEPHPEHAAAQR
ncbi:MAG: GntR family transcriptional regulator [Phyllobacterium sp.]|jgi:GntR family transcriptional regulator, trigonelline degradation regulator|uniref:GntR family transcriptional regulator n=1 Tax=Phyllobacterium sp. TaxID=1871046 RepID=UPI0030EFEC01